MKFMLVLFFGFSVVSHASVDQITYEAALNNPNAIFCYQKSKWNWDKNAVGILAIPGTPYAEIRSVERLNHVIHTSPLNKILSFYILPGDQSKWGNVGQEVSKTRSFMNLQLIRDSMKKLNIQAQDVGSVTVAASQYSEAFIDTDYRGYIKFNDHDGRQIKSLYVQGRTERYSNHEERFDVCLDQEQIDTSERPSIPQYIKARLHGLSTAELLQDVLDHFEVHIQNRFGGSAKTAYWLDPRDGVDIVMSHMGSDPGMSVDYTYVNPQSKEAQRQRCYFTFSNGKATHSAVFKSLECTDIPPSPKVNELAYLGPNVDEWYLKYMQSKLTIRDSFGRYLPTEELKNLEQKLTDDLKRNGLGGIIIENISADFSKSQSSPLLIFDFLIPADKVYPKVNGRCGFVYKHGLLPSYVSHTCTKQ